MFFVPAVAVVVVVSVVIVVISPDMAATVRCHAQTVLRVQSGIQTTHDHRAGSANSADKSPSQQCSWRLRSSARRAASFARLMRENSTALRLYPFSCPPLRTLLRAARGSWFHGAAASLEMSRWCGEPLLALKGRCRMSLSGVRRLMCRGSRLRPARIAVQQPPRLCRGTSARCARALPLLLSPRAALWHFARQRGSWPQAPSVTRVIASASYFLVQTCCVLLRGRPQLLRS